MRALPENATRSYNKPNLTNVKINNQARLVVPEGPTIPPAPRVVREAEIVREPPKPINELIAIPTGDRKIMLDTGKFRSELRIALINGAKVWLSHNNAKEVIKIDEKTN